MGEENSCLMLAASISYESRRWKCLADNSGTSFYKMYRLADLEENF